MTRQAFETLLDQARAAHESQACLAEFCRFPDDLHEQAVAPFHVPAAELLSRESGLYSDVLSEFRDAFVAASPMAQWRETYKDTNIGQDFMDRFACYSLIGEGGPWVSTQMSSYVVYMPANLYYPWHHHPAEELYLVLAGEAEFMREGAEPETLRPGDHSFHASNQPHAMRTGDHPVMAYVVWRNNLQTPPVLTEREVA